MTEPNLFRDAHNQDTKEQLKQLEDDLYRAADSLWAKSGMKASGYSTPMLGLVDGSRLPAELVILDLELAEGEEGVWMNSRKPESGVVDLLQLDEDRYKTSRLSVPEVVSDLLRKVYVTAKLQKGCLDLVIWNCAEELLRLVDVKCPHGDRPTPEQEVFMDSAESLGIPTSIVEWEFEDE